jgi:tRNA(His) 5'-end guanylyltransferase
MTITGRNLASLMVINTHLLFSISDSYSILYVFVLFMFSAFTPTSSAGFSSLYLYRRWYRCVTSLSSFSFDDGHVERKDDLVLDQFHSQYDGKSPVSCLKFLV